MKQVFRYKGIVLQMAALAVISGKAQADENFLNACYSVVEANTREAYGDLIANSTRVRDLLLEKNFRRFSAFYNAIPNKPQLATMAARIHAGQEEGRTSITFDRLPLSFQHMLSNALRSSFAAPSDVNCSRGFGPVLNGGQYSHGGYVCQNGEIMQQPLLSSAIEFNSSELEFKVCSQSLAAPRTNDPRSGVLSGMASGLIQICSTFGFREDGSIVRNHLLHIAQSNDSSPYDISVPLQFRAMEIQQHDNGSDITMTVMPEGFQFDSQSILNAAINSEKEKYCVDPDFAVAPTQSTQAEQSNASGLASVSDTSRQASVRPTDQGTARNQAEVIARPAVNVVSSNVIAASALDSPGQTSVPLPTPQQQAQPVVSAEQDNSRPPVSTSTDASTNTGTRSTQAVSPVVQSSSDQQVPAPSSTTVSTETSNNITTNVSTNGAPAAAVTSPIETTVSTSVETQLTPEDSAVVQEANHILAESEAALSHPDVQTETQELVRAAPQAATQIHSYGSLETFSPSRDFASGIVTHEREVNTSRVTSEISTAGTSETLSQQTQISAQAQPQVPSQSVIETNVQDRYLSQNRGYLSQCWQRAMRNLNLKSGQYRGSLSVEVDTQGLVTHAQITMIDDNRSEQIESVINSCLVGYNQNRDRSATQQTLIFENDGEGLLMSAYFAYSSLK